VCPSFSLLKGGGADPREMEWPAPPSGALKEEKAHTEYHISSVVFLSHIERTGKGD